MLTINLALSCTADNFRALCLQSLQEFAQDMKGIQAAVEILSQNSPDKEYYRTQFHRVTELLVPLFNTSETLSSDVSRVSKLLSDGTLEKKVRGAFLSSVEFY